MKKKVVKPVRDMTSDELADKVFPPEVKAQLKKIAKDADEKAERRSSQKQ